jgi:hypothetical protein
MALSYTAFVSDGGTVQYDVPFGYLSKQHVFVFVNDELRGFKWISGTRIELLVAAALNAPIRIQRLTERATRVTNFTDGQTLLAGDLNAGDLQNFYVMQELIDQIADALLLGDLTVLNPDGGWITAAWIAEQIDSSAPPAALANLAALIASEELARANAVVAEANARAQGLSDEALARANAVAAEASARAQGLLDEALARVDALAVVDAALVAETSARAQGLSDEALARANAVAAEASARAQGLLDEALARVNALAVVDAALVAETSARADADGALATSLTGLLARTEDAEAAILANDTARSDADSAFAESLGLISARTTDAEAAILANDTARSDADSALAESIGLISARTTDAEAAILANDTARSDADSALAESIGLISARTTDAEAAILANDTARSDADSAFAESLGLITARTTDAEAAILANDTARSDADSALAESIGLISARTTDAEADIIDLGAAITTESSARVESVGILDATLAVNRNRMSGLEDSLVKNSAFQQEFTGLAVPPMWNAWSSPATGSFVPRSIGSGYAFRVNTVAGANHGILQEVPISDTGKYLISAEIRRLSGPLTGAGILYQCRNSVGAIFSSQYLYFATEANTSGAITATPDGVVRWEKEWTPPAGAVSVKLHVMSHFSSMGSISSANSIEWREVSIRPVTLAQSQGTLNKANITTVEEALATETLTRASSITSLSAQQAASPVGTNGCSDTGFYETAYYWAQDGTATTEGAIVYYTLPSGLRVKEYSRTATAVSQYIRQFSYSKNGISCVPGDTIGLRAHVGFVGPGTHARIQATWRTASGVYVGQSNGPNTPIAGFSGSGELSTFTTVTHVAVAPAGAVKCHLEVWVYSTGSGVMTLRFCQPVVALMPAGSTVPPYFNHSSVTAGEQNSTLQANITTVSNAQVTANTARASEISVLQTKSNRQSNSNLIANPYFDQGPASGIPLSWNNWSNVFDITSVALPEFPGETGMYYSTRTSGNAQGLVWFTTHSVVPGKRYIIRATFKRVGGSLTYSGLYVQFKGSNTANVGVPNKQAFNTARNTEGAIVGNTPDGWQTIEYSVIPPDGTTMAAVYLMGAATIFGTLSGTVQMYVREFNMYPVHGIGAGVGEIRTALTDSTGDFAYYGIKVNAGDNSVASIEAMSDTKTSLSKLKLKADKIEMDGNVIINGSLYKEAISSGELTKSAFSTTLGSYIMTSDWTTKGTIYLVVPAGASLVRIDWSLGCRGVGSSSGTNLQVRILRGGVDISGAVTMVAVLPSIIFATPQQPSGTAVPAAVGGTYADFIVDVGATLGSTNTYTLQVRKDVNVGSISADAFKLFGTAYAR